jgi:subtilisin family serine protease
MRVERYQERYFLSILILLFFSLVSWTKVYSEEALYVKGEKEGHPKIDSALFDLQRGYLTHGKGISQAYAQRRNLRIDDQDKITVYILPKPGESKDAIDVETLKAYGGEIVKSGHSIIKAKVPISLLDQIADHVEGINFIKQPNRPHIEVVSEGVNLTGASFYQASGYAGQNVNVAIIDLGFAKLTDAINAGVLPGSVIKIDCTQPKCAPTDFSSEEEEHGTAVSEIVHDMAPGAQLYLIKVDGLIDLMNAKDYCIANGIRIINHSVGWVNTNFYDGACYFDNPVCTANHAYKNGILWVNSAGNEARNHYEATFVDRDGDRLHNVTQDNNFISLHVDGNLYPIMAFLTWDAWPATDQDYDLLLFNSAMELVASSTNLQTGTQPPEEAIYYLPPTAGTYYLAVRNSSTTSNHRFQIFSFNQELNPYVATNSLMGPADATGVMAVAAINYTQWGKGPQEYFSSQGPTSDGRIKPEISGPDGVSNFVYGSFLGTSASSPHVAGAGALILSNNRTFAASQLWNALTSSAIDLGASGQDPIFGYGRLNLSTISADPASIDFGNVIVGQFIERTMTVRNVGNPNLVIGAITAPSAPYMLISDSCSGTFLSLGESCTLKIRFSPSSIGSFNSALMIPSNDPFNSLLTVSLMGKGVLVINLSLPMDQFSVNPCSIQVPPIFEWGAPPSFIGYEIQFSADPSFASIPVRIRASGTPIYTLNPFQWKRVLSVLGSEGGTIYWRVVGTASNGAQSISDERSLFIPPPQPVGNPGISPLNRDQLPVLTWQNQCNTKFRVWFSDASSLRQMSLHFQIPDPALNGGIFSDELTSTQWLRIRMVVGNKPGSTVNWFVESWDGLNRNATTAVMSFSLQD